MIAGMFGYEVDWGAAPAWVQAVGSVGAIFAAIWLQGRLIDRQHAERQNGYRDLVLAVMQDARDMVESVAAFLSQEGMPPIAATQFVQQLRTRNDLLLKIDHRDARAGVVDQVLVLSSGMQRIATLEEAAASSRLIVPGNELDFYLEDARKNIRGARRIYGLSPEAPDVMIES
jgi:hypothetical protein